jgi:hypothetical protein
VISSVGLEHYFDRVGVTGSNPVSPTKLTAFFAVLQHQRRFFYDFFLDFFYVWAAFSLFRQQLIFLCILC